MSATSAAAACSTGAHAHSNADATYERGRPEDSVLYKVLQAHLETFLRNAGELDGSSSVPRFVENELRAFLDCGVLARGLIRLHCTGCGHDIVVGLSCKRRGFCPRCGGRRMTQTALHLTEHVIPKVRVRQWVLTVPHRYRYRIGYDHALCKRFLRALNRELQAYYRNKSGQREGQTGCVIFIQRFNGELALSPHYHVVALDGVFVQDAEHGLRFVEVSEPSKLDVAEIVSAVHARIHGVLQRLGLEEQDQESDALALDSPALAACYTGSITRRVALGQNAGQAVVKLGAQPNVPWVEINKPRHANYEGFDLHADVALAADNRQGLEQLLRYVARPAVASDRLRLTPDGRVSLELKRRYHDGTTHLLMQPTTFIERLAALVPRPQKNLTIYSGVLAPNAKLRSKVVAFGAPAELPQPAAVTAPEPASEEPTQLPLAASAEPSVGGVQPAATDNPAELPQSAAVTAPELASGEPSQLPLAASPEPSVGGAQPDATNNPPKPAKKRRRPNYTWAELMRHSFSVDVLQCQHCGGRLKMLAVVMSPAAVRSILASLGLPTEAPELRPARAPPEPFERA